MIFCQHLLRNLKDTLKGLTLYDLPILLTFKRKQIIRDQNWFKAESELPKENLF